jgi:hypothetical protein
MTEIFHRGRAYYRRSWNNEYEFEQFVYAVAGELFPFLNCYKFKVDIYSEFMSRTMRADLILIDENYSRYIVVEVELITDNISHVKEQAEVFSTANYTDSMAEYLCRRNEGVDFERLHDLFTFQDPEVLVLLNDSRISNRWLDVCIDRNVHLAFLEVFKAETREPIYRFTGYVPETIDCLSISGRKSIYMNNLIVEEPSRISANSEGKVHILDNGTIVPMMKQGEILFPLASSSIHTAEPGSSFTLNQVEGADYFQLMWDM